MSTTSTKFYEQECDAKENILPNGNFSAPPTPNNKSKVSENMKLQPLDNFTHELSLLKTAFDGAIGSLLLYRYERQQYHVALDYFKGKQPPHKIYGAQHLLRFLGILSNLLCSSSI